MSRCAVAIWWMWRWRQRDSLSRLIVLFCPSVRPIFAKCSLKCQPINTPLVCVFLPGVVWVTNETNAFFLFFAVFLKDVSHTALKDLIQFMYCGEVNVKQEALPAFISTAEALQIKGLTDVSIWMPENVEENINDFVDWFVFIAILFWLRFSAFSVVNFKMCIARFTAFFKAWYILMVVGLSGFSFYASTAIMIVCVFVYWFCVEAQLYSGYLYATRIFLYKYLCV